MESLARSGMPYRTTGAQISSAKTIRIARCTRVTEREVRAGSGAVCACEAEGRVIRSLSLAVFQRLSRTGRSGYGLIQTFIYTEQVWSDFIPRILRFRVPSSRFTELFGGCVVSRNDLLRGVGGISRSEYKPAFAFPDNPGQRLGIGYQYGFRGNHVLENRVRDGGIDKFAINVRNQTQIALVDVRVNILKRNPA